MNRREFVRTSALGVAATAFGCEGGEKARETGGAASGPRAPAGFELDEATFSSLQEKMKSGELTSRRITELYLARIEEIDRNGPTLRSILETNPDALQQAEALDRERREKGPRGPLHGIPLLLKDNIDTADRMTTTAGSLALEGSIPERDAWVVTKLREAGAVLLAKTNLSEWANFRSEHSSSGWSGRGGQCRNPYALDRNPCGSSSGSGAATSANLGAASLGTETDGSIVCPSNANGLVGIKPTLGLVSRAGIVPVAHSQDTAGPMTRTVTDAVILLGALTGVDPRDPATRASEGKSSSDYTPFLDRAGLRAARLGVLRDRFGFNSRVDKLMEEALEAMKREGAEIIDPVAFPAKDDVGPSEIEVLLFEFKADLNAYLSGLGSKAPAKSLKDVIDFNERHRDREMPYFGQELFLRAEEKGPLTTPAYVQALARNHRLTRDEGIDAVMEKNRLDAIVAPTGGPAWLTDLVTGDHFSGGSSTPAAVAGYPNISVPAGYVHGLPLGISLFGRAFSEPTLIKIAYAFEQLTRFRRAPKFLPSAEM